ncbi:MAG TPA: hypothetical protein VF940_24300 [Streptosporangiaceae bacterium]
MIIFGCGDWQPGIGCRGQAEATARLRPRQPRLSYVRAGGI